MARYDWPGSPPESRDDKLALRGNYFHRFWSHIADGFLESTADDFYDILAQLAEAAITEAELDRKRWLPIGPSVILRGQASGSPRVAGRVRDIKSSPDGSRLYAASANGGVWFSGDGGQSWAPLGGMATTPDPGARGRSGNSLVMGCLYVEFGANADADVIYAGTGEPAFDYSNKGIPGAKSGGIGILKLSRTVTAALADPTGNPWEREAPNLTGAGIYRIVRDPDSTHPEQFVAATTFGLFKRDGAFVRNADWTRVNVAPFNVQNTDRVFATDAAWVPAATAPAAAPARLFVSLVNLGDTDRESAVYVSSGTGGPFSKITLAGYTQQKRLALGAVMPVAATPTTHPQIVYVLSGQKNASQLWRIDGTASKVVRDTPPQLFGGTRTIGANTRETNDQSWYDMAVAADPNNPAVVYVGGSVEYGSSDWDASLYRGTITGTAAADNFSFGFQAANVLTPNADATFIGLGVHADVHVLRVSDDGNTVLVGCDGGIFASTSGGGPLSFSARNTGLAVTECGFVASHPGHAGPVAAGTQDNGVIRRIGDTVWQYQDWGGDGGGVCFHPQPGREAFLMGQYTKVDWNGNGHFDPPIERKGFAAARFATEKTRSLFYSGSAAAPGATAGKARLAVGSYRLWLTEDWDPLSPAAPLMVWQTLPSARDPYAPASGDFSQDEIDESAGKVVSVKWLDRGTLNGTVFQGSKLLVLYERAIARVYQEPGKTEWKREILAWSKKKRITEDSDIPAGGAPSEKLPWLGAWSEIAPHRATKEGDANFKGSFYVSTTGSSLLTNTGITESLRMDTLWWFDGKEKFYPSGLRNSGTKAPAFSVVCDPENPDFVYVGTAMGVWRGTLTQIGEAPPAWTWVMFSIGLPEAFVQDLSIHWNPAAPNGGLKLLRAAIQSRGVWEVDISANPASVGKSYLRVHPLDTGQILPTNLTHLTDETATPTPYPRCLSPDITLVRPPVPASWPGGVPTEADITALTRPESLIGPAANRIRAELVTANGYSAFVMVHHRHTNPVPAADVKVALLKRRVTAAEGDGGGIALSAAWKNTLVNLLVNDQNGTLDDHWRIASAAETTNPATNAIAVADIRNPAGPVDARMPRAAAFQLNLTGAPDGQRYLLLAVMSSARDPLRIEELSGATVAEVVLGSRHACSRLVMEAPVEWVTNHVLLEHFDRATASIVTEAVPATPAELANNFYNAELPGTVKDPALQPLLTAVLNKPAFRAVRSSIAVALVDLSGANKFAPKYAGFNDRMNLYAASTGKVSGLLAAYQLKADATNVLSTTTPAITSFAALETELRRRWTTVGIAKRNQPDVGSVLEWRPGAPPGVVLKPELLARFDDISHGNENGSTAIVLMKFPFIASTLLAHGLFSPADKSGLWCRAAFGPITYLGRRMTIGPWSRRDNPFPDTPSNSVSAVAIAQFMTLAAQGRMIDRTTSQTILDHLNIDRGGCATDQPDLSALQPLGSISVKCGIFGEFLHVPLHFKASAGSREFVAVILTRNNKFTVVHDLFAELVALVP